MTFISTLTGRIFDYSNPRASDVCIGDIVSGLGKCCRFAGQCEKFYGVLEHSCHVCDLLPDEHKYAGLMHDAPEAYYGDMTRPMKDSLLEKVGDRFKWWLEAIDRAVFIALYIPYPLPPEVKTADRIMLFTEQRDLMHRISRPWKDPYPPADFIIEPWSEFQAECEFLNRYEKWRPK